ncbi:hypothetical protein ABZ816_39030 [Actinosynnema sp. NPDC047251]|nr:hypothetical protein [Saccharothrix espanaensis]
MDVRRSAWVVLVVAGAVMAVGGVVWLFVVLGTEEADRISSGIGAGTAVMGLAVGVLGMVKGRVPEPDGESTVAAGQSVMHSMITGSNVQVGGSVHGDVNATGRTAGR